MMLPLGLLCLRTTIVGIAACIALGPTMIDEELGETTRPMLCYVLDGSQSMQLGREATRWQESLQFIADAEKAAGAANTTHCKAFRFGHRLMPLASTDSVSKTGIKPVRFTDADQLAPPDATDSRLADALRQLSPQIDPASSAGVVLLTDGRVRATESVERLAEHYGKLGIPIHVVPVGELEGTGDVAIVSLVVEPRVRKYTENQMTLFLRSFGFNGERTVVRVVSKSKIANDINDANVTLAEMPVTLSGGAQSVSLTFRVEERPEVLLVIVEPLKGELTDRNNRIQTRVEIDRTKLRVLYIEGEAAGQQSMLGSTDGFPKSRAELFAYDWVVFSNLRPDVLEEEQLQQLALWVEGRGGGLIVTGSQSLEANAWVRNPLAPLLPILTEPLRSGSSQPTAVTVSQPNHPIWRLRMEQNPNEQLVHALPPLSMGVGGIEAKPSTDVVG